MGRGPQDFSFSFSRLLKMLKKSPMLECVLYFSLLFIQRKQLFFNANNCRGKFLQHILMKKYNTDILPDNWVFLHELLTALKSCLVEVDISNQPDRPSEYTEPLGNYLLLSSEPLYKLRTNRGFGQTKLKFKTFYQSFVQISQVCLTHLNNFPFNNHAP